MRMAPEALAEMKHGSGFRAIARGKNRHPNEGLRRVGPVGVRADEERRRIAVAPQPQPGFQHARGTARAQEPWPSAGTATCAAG